MNFYKIDFLICIAPWIISAILASLPYHDQDDADGKAMTCAVVFGIGLVIDVSGILAAVVKWLFF